MAFNRDPRLFPITPSYPQMDNALLIKEKKELKKQADELYFYKEHLKKEIEQSKQTTEQMSIQLENVIVENTKNIEKLKEAEKSADYHSNKYHSLKRKIDDEINEIELSADKKYNKLDDKYRDLMMDYKTLCANYDDLQKEFESIKCKKSHFKNVKARLCYYSKKCKRDECMYAHSIDELTICPKGNTCHQDGCNYIIHSDIGRVMFRGFYGGKEEALCRDFDKFNACAYNICNKIHYCNGEQKF